MQPANIEAYPLCWPIGWKRANVALRSSFKVPTFGVARDGLLNEIRLMGGRDVVLSTNIPLRLDGLPYAGRAQPVGAGVAVYFTYKNSPMCFACDSWDRVRDNARAIEKTIAAIRGVERWGASDMMERAFTGFLQLESPGVKKDWRRVLGFAPGECPDLDDVEYAFRKLARIHHPDKGGDHNRFAELQRARTEARETLVL